MTEEWSEKASTRKRYLLKAFMGWDGRVGKGIPIIKSSV